MKWIPYKPKLRSCALKAVAIIVLLPTLTSCAWKSSQSALNIYQTPTLSIAAGTVVTTKEGVYTAQRDEEWVAMSRYAELEQKYLNAIGK